MLLIAHAEETVSSESGSPIVAIILWAFLLGFVLVLFIQKWIKKRQYKDVHFENDTDWLELSAPLYPVDNKVYQYFFHYDKSFFAQGHLMEDREHKLVYEAKFLYNNVTGNDEVDFINHILNCKSHHQLSHVTSSSVGNENVSITLDSKFKFDNQNVYQYLENLGFSYRTDIHGLTVKYLIYYHDTEIGSIFTTNMGKDYFAGKPLAPKLGGNGFYIVEGENKYMDILFLYAIVFTRCDISAKHR